MSDMSIRYANDFLRNHEDVCMSYEANRTWTYISVNMRQMVNEGIIPGEAEGECMVSFIPAPTLNGAVEAAYHRYRIECAVRGIDA